MNYPVHWYTGGAEPSGPGIYWDTALIEELLIPERHDPAPGEGAVVVVPGRSVNDAQIPALNRYLATLP